jgi:uroporphyrinogen-III synthase
MTATVLERGGIKPALIPPRFVAESLVEAFPRGHGVAVVAQAAGARHVVADGIAAKGWDVRVVEAYRTAALAPPAEALEAARNSDAILFTSASTVSSYVSAAGVDGVPPVVVIGPVTAGGRDRPGRDRHRGARRAHDPGDGRSAGRGAAPA